VFLVVPGSIRPRTVGGMANTPKPPITFLMTSRLDGVIFGFRNVPVISIGMARLIGIFLDFGFMSMFRVSFFRLAVPAPVMMPCSVSRTKVWNVTMPLVIWA